jgi:hypothetical protein
MGSLPILDIASHQIEQSSSPPTFCLVASRSGRIPDGVDRMFTPKPRRTDGIDLAPT